MTEIAIFEADNGEIQVTLEQDMVWLSQANMMALFERDQSVLSRHIRNVFKEGELLEKSNMQKMHIANSDKPVTFYSLDVIISVGYRVKSPQGVRFRQWATSLLKEHLTKGYTLNQQRFEQNANELEAALALIKKTAQSPAITAEMTVNDFEDTTFNQVGGLLKARELFGNDLNNMIQELNGYLIA